MTTGLVRLAGDGSRGVSVGLLVCWEPLEKDGEPGISLHLMGGRTLNYWGDDARRIVAWLKEHSDLPIVAPG